jgi:hypothetical protein
VTYGFAAFSKRGLTSCALTSCANLPSLQRLPERKPAPLLSLCLSLLRYVDPDAKPSRKHQNRAG